MSDEADVYRSEGMGLRSSRIWELRLPTRPSFVQDLFAVPVPGGVHVLGADGMTLGGESATWVLSDLAPLLDGTRTIAELRAELPDISASSLLDVLYLMHMHGMLEEGDDVASPDWRMEVDKRFGAQGKYFSRYLRVTGHCRNRYDAQRALAGARVGVVGCPVWGPTLARQLETSGVGTIHCQMPAPDRVKSAAIEWDSDGHAQLSDVDLVVCLGDALQQEEVARVYLDRRCALLFVDPAALRLGPLTYPRESACPVCAQVQLILPASDPSTQSQAVRRMWSAALVSRATQQAIGHLTGLFQPKVVEGVEVWAPQDGASTLQEVLWLPGCELCGDEVSPLTVTTPAGAKDNMALLYHRNVAIRPWHIHQPAGMQHHLSTDVQKLTRGAYLSHNWAERLRLPTPTMRGHLIEEVVGPSAPASAIATDLAALSNLLFYSVGGTSTPLGDSGFHLRRHTASGGNLGSAEVYVVTSNVAGLPGGIYHYVIVDNSLERLRVGQFVNQVSDCITTDPNDTTASLVTSSAAILVVVSAVQRLRAKYAERGYQYCLLDAGLVAHRIDALASRISLRTQPIWEFDDERLSDVLGVDGLSLAPTLLIALGHAAEVNARRE